MSRNFFDQEEGEFRDVPDEVAGKDAAPVANPVTRRPIQNYAPVPVPQQEEVYEEEELEIPELEDEDDYSAVLSDARLRLEQGRLYEMIMNHDLFEGMDSDPAAIKHVQRQIRKFAKEQMEIMLGMRKETSKIERLEIDFPFNQIEVDVLKRLAFTATKGQSSNSDAYVPEVKRTTEEVPVVPKKTTLNSIVSKKPQAVPVKMQPKAPTPVAKAPSKPLQSAPNQPVKRKPLNQTAHQILAEEQVTPEELDKQFEPDYKPLDKPLHEMSADEILQRNRDIEKRRNKTVKSTNATPMPSFEQESMIHQQRVLENGSANSAVNLILNAMNKR